MSMISELLDNLRQYSAEYDLPPFGREIEGTKELLNQAADTIEALSAKLAKANMEQSERYYSGGWIACKDRLPEESLNSVIGWDEYRGRCCFVHYVCGRFALGDDTESVKIVAWQPLPKPYNPNVCTSDCPFNDKKGCPAAEGCAGFELKKQTNADI